MIQGFNAPENAHLKTELTSILGTEDPGDIFDMLDVDGSGQIDFDEFYLLSCILVALKVSKRDQIMK